MKKTKSSFKNLYNKIFDSIPSVFFELDGSGKIVRCSSSAEKAFGAEKNELCLTNIADLFTTETDTAYFNDCLNGIKEITGYEFTSSGRDDREIILRAENLNAIEGGGFFFFASDITDEAEKEEKNLLLNEELERKRKAEKAYSEPDNFCAVIAHEFKAPIRAIGLYNHIIAEETKGSLSRDAENAVLKIDEYCSRSLDLIKNLLEYSRLRPQKLNIRSIDMNKLINSCVRDLKTIYSGIDIRVEMPQLPVISGDEFLLKQAVYNILDNSIKFSSVREHTEINISCSSSDDEYMIMFRDNGAGFDMSDTEDPFSLFSRMHTSDEFEGTGIGLATVKNVIEKHGGRVQICSKPDNGCLVVISLKK